MQCYSDSDSDMLSIDWREQRSQDDFEDNSDEDMDMGSELAHDGGGDGKDTNMDLSFTADEEVDDLAMDINKMEM